jgi:hypothetical protein
MPCNENAPRASRAHGESLSSRNAGTGQSVGRWRRIRSSPIDEGGAIDRVETVTRQSGVNGGRFEALFKSVNASLVVPIREGSVRPRTLRPERATCTSAFGSNGGAQVVLRQAITRWHKVTCAGCVPQVPQLALLARPYFRGLERMPAQRLQRLTWLLTLASHLGQRRALSLRTKRVRGRLFMARAFGQIFGKGAV